MGNRVVVRKSFLGPAKKLAKRYRSFHDDVAKLIDELSLDASFGTPLGKNVYKIRLGIASKARGKRGGARVITYVYRSAQTVYLMFVYDKADMDAIPETDLRVLVTELEREIEASLKNKEK